MRRWHRTCTPEQKFKKFTKIFYLSSEKFDYSFNELRTHPAENAGKKNRSFKKFVKFSISHIITII